MSNQSHRRHQFSRTCEPGQSHDRTCDTMRMIRSSITGAYNFLGCTSSKLATQCGGQLMLMQFCTDAALTRPLSSMCSCSYISRRRYDILYVSYGGQCLRGMVSKWTMFARNGFTMLRCHPCCAFCIRWCYCPVNKNSNYHIQMQMFFNAEQLILFSTRKPPAALFRQPISLNVKAIWLYRHHCWLDGC